MKIKQHQNPEDVLRGKGERSTRPLGRMWPILTTQQGTPVSDDQNSLKIEARVPTKFFPAHLRGCANQFCGPWSALCFTPDRLNFPQVGACTW